MERLDSVAWVGLYQPAYKLSPELARDGTNLYRVRVERGADAGQATAAIAQSGVPVLSRNGSYVLVAANEAQLKAIARVLDVAWVENLVLKEKHNESGAGVILGANTANANGYDGSTQTAAVSDTGLGGGTAATAHPDIPASCIVSIYNWPGATNICFQSITDDGPQDVESGHGTHTAVSVLGDGDDSGEGKGTAPAASLVFQATENWATISNYCQILGGWPAEGYFLTGLPDDLRAMYQQAYNDGARIHSNSWGSADRVNNVENVYVQSAAAGTWTVEVIGFNVPQGTQPFALVVDGNLDGMPSTPTPTPTPEPGATMHVGDLDGSSAPAPKNRWNATVTITVHDANEALVADATVYGTWSDGATGSAVCTTDASGQCSLSKNNLKSNVANVTFTIDNVTYASNTYDAGANHDPDGDSDGTVIVVYKDGPPTPTPIPTSTPTPGPGVVMHVGDLDGSSVTAPRNRWEATVTITVHDAGENPVENATVEGSWSDGASGGGSCVTNASGQCSVTKVNIKGNMSSVTFTVNNVTLAGSTYDAGANQDPDGDSNGTTITVPQR